MKKLGCLILLLAGCASEPPVLGPSILVLPGSGKTFDMFRADDTECRQYATTQSAGVDDEKLMQHLASERIPHVTFDGAEAYSVFGEHWTPAGHRLVAERLMGLLSDNKLVAADQPAK